jgi:hypothetical protein
MASSIVRPGAARPGARTRSGTLRSKRYGDPWLVPFPSTQSGSKKLPGFTTM